MKNLFVLIVLLAFIGCTSVNEQVTLTSGEKIRTKGVSFLTTITGLKRTVTATNGTVYAFSMDNYSGDSTMATVLFNGAVNLAKVVAVAANTNLMVSTNFAIK